MKSGYDEEERTRAGARIMEQQGTYGGARPSALAWLLTFAQEPVTALSITELALRWQEVRRFAEDAGLAEGPPLTNQRSVRPQLPPVFDSPYTWSRPSPGPGEREFLDMLRRAVNVDLKLYVNGKRTRMNGLSIDLEVRAGTPGVFIHAANLDTGFFYQMFHLLGDLGSRIRQCRGCDRLFLAGRSDKTWCSGSCQAMAWKRANPQKPTKKKPKKKQPTKGERHGKTR